MKYNELTISKNTQSTRVGRGISAGKGKTAGRGTKGQKSRTGSGKRPGFEGGQTPLYMRVPKLGGFRSLRPKTEEISTTSLNGLNGRVSNLDLYEAGLVSSPYNSVKIINNGDVTKKIQISVQAVSKSAKANIEKAGGSVTIIQRPRREKSAKKDK